MADLLETQNYSASHDAQSAACYFLESVFNPPMAIWSKKLHDFEQHGATKNDDAYEKNVPRIGQAKEQAEQSKCS